MDSNYLLRMHQRTAVIRDHHSAAIQTSPEIAPAVNELYTWMVNSYLPIRFPSVFKFAPKSVLFNTATNLSLPLTAPIDPVETFELLGKNIDEDFLILIPSEDGDGYTLKGHVVCNASGFNAAEKFGLKLRDIHGPVPGYKQKLEKSMDRFFERLEVGKVVVRWNVSIGSRVSRKSANETSGRSKPTPGSSLLTKPTISTHTNQSQTLPLK